jgi:murein DD-endopeptidase MepM/ murein hydrolase activator NlpD
MRLLVHAAAAALITVTGVSVAALPDVALPVVAVPVTAAPAPTADSRPLPDPGQVGVDDATPVATGVTRSGAFDWPLSPRPAVQRRFEQPRSQWSAGHRGVDLRTIVGQRVLSAGDGVVAFSGKVAGRGVITVRHSGGLRTTYEPVEERLASGARVRRGTRIGVLAPTAGHCVPLSCLHWGAISESTYRDPLSLLGFGRPILLPLG